MRLALPAPVNLSFDATRQQPADEVALQGEEHDHRDDDRNESTSSQKVEVAAEGTGQLLELDRNRLRTSVLGREGEADQQVVPDPQKLEDGKRRNSWQRQRHDDPPVDVKVAGSIDAGSFDQLVGQLGNEVV